jgi:hypothetical protein
MSLKKEFDRFLATFQTLKTETENLLLNDKQKYNDNILRRAYFSKFGLLIIDIEEYIEKCGSDGSNTESLKIFNDLIDEVNDFTKILKLIPIKQKFSLIDYVDFLIRFFAVTFGFLTAGIVIINLSFHN